MGNNQGSVYKIKSGKRRRPYVARATAGYTDEGKQLYYYIGYFETQKEAMTALFEYNINNGKDTTNNKNLNLEQLYQLWSKKHYPTISQSGVNMYENAFKKYLKELHSKKWISIKTPDFQKIIDNCNRGYQTKHGIRVLVSQLSNYAISQEISTKNHGPYLDCGKNDQKKEKKIFSDEDIKTLWKNVKKIPEIKTILILLYTGTRIEEMLSFKIENVHLEDEYPYIIGGIKTASGRNRTIVLNKKILPIVKEFYEQNKNNTYLITNSNGQKYTYGMYRNNIWDKVMEELNMNFTCHCTRHTCISLLHKAGADPLNIKRIVGHSNGNITEHYIHSTLKELSDTINLI